MAGLNDYLVCYDVETATDAGRRRLQRVAKVCLRFGQRVQKSVFECRVSPASLDRLRRKISDVIDPDTDSVRFYRLSGARTTYLEIMGIDRSYDLDGPLLFGSADLRPDPGDDD